MKFLPGNKHCKAIVFGHLDKYRDPYLRTGLEPVFSVEDDILYINEFIMDNTMSEADRVDMAEAYRSHKAKRGYVI